MPARAPRRPVVSVWRDWAVVAALFWINGLVLLNALLHSPFVGYDALDHLRFITVLAGGHLPGPDDTTEFFAAPLPYVLPALVRALATDRWGVVVKAAQLQNVAWSIGLTLMLVRLCQAIRPGDRVLARWSLVLLGTAPVYYKTFAFVRGEPLAAFLAVVVAERALAMVASRGGGARDQVVLGSAIGLLVLAKQWGVFVAGAVFVFLSWHLIAERARGRERVRGFAVVWLVAALVGGWYYLSLQQRFGSVAAFNDAPGARWALSNRPMAFYADLGLPALFTDPIRERFALDGSTSLLPVLYADFWGDYWCYWVVHAEDPAGGWASGPVLVEVAAANPAASNRATIGAYLGRVNAVALLPTMTALAGLWLGLTRLWTMLVRGELAADHSGPGLAALIVLATAGGYFALLVGYPGLDVKAAYLLPMVPFVAVLAAAALARLARSHPHHHQRLGLALLLVGVHNAPLFVTRFVW